VALPAFILASRERRCFISESEESGTAAGLVVAVVAVAVAVGGAEGSFFSRGFFAVVLSKGFLGSFLLVAMGSWLGLVSGASRSLRASSAFLRSSWFTLALWATLPRRSFFSDLSTSSAAFAMDFSAQRSWMEVNSGAWRSGELTGISASLATAPSWSPTLSAFLAASRVALALSSAATGVSLGEESLASLDMLTTTRPTSTRTPAATAPMTTPVLVLGWEASLGSSSLPVRAESCIVMLAWGR